MDLESDKINEDNNLQKSLSGVAQIKKEFVVHRELKVEDSKGTNENFQQKNKKRKTGQNYNRPKLKKEDPTKKLCRKYWCGKLDENLSGETCSRKNCPFSHDVETFLENKLDDIGEKCHSFDSYGFCPYGVTCRYGKSHIENFQTILDEKKYQNYIQNQPIRNFLSLEAQTALRKRTYDFTKSKKAVTNANDFLKKISENHEILDKEKLEIFNHEKSENHEILDKEKLEIFNHEKSENHEILDKEKLEIFNNEKSESHKNLNEQILENIENSSFKKLESREKLNFEKSNINENLNIGKLENLNSEKPEMNENLSKEKLKTAENFQTEPSQIKMHPREKKKIDWRDKLYLAPLTTLGNLPFRRVCKRLGADITCSEMAVATSLLQAHHSEWALMRRHSSEDVFGVQLCGNKSEVLTRCCQLLSEQIDMDFVDLNMGCPIELIFNQGAGSALMRRNNALAQIVNGMTQILPCEVTLKMRTGVYKDLNVAHNIMAKAKTWGVSLFTLHGRSKEQRYLRSANWDYVTECRKVAEPIPLYGNGDVLTFEDYQMRKTQSGVAGIMIGRGALIKPWIFTEIKEKRHWDISSNERLELLREYTNYGLEHWGSDTEGVEKTRRFLLEWLSFLYRYIPVGVLEVPQGMNQRPPSYMGRNDLETLMASPSVKDWVKISELLLGPVPNDFDFLPKHKANAWS